MAPPTYLGKSLWVESAEISIPPISIIYVGLDMLSTSRNRGHKDLRITYMPIPNWLKPNLIIYTEGCGATECIPHHLCWLVYASYLKEERPQTPQNVYWLVYAELVYITALKTRLLRNALPVKGKGEVSGDATASSSTAGILASKEEPAFCGRSRDSCKAANCNFFVTLQTA